MWPILLEPPTVPVPVHTYPVVLAATLVVAFVVGLHDAARSTGRSRARLAAALGLLTLASLAGARLHFLLAPGRPSLSSAWRLWDGGMHVAGGLAGLGVGLLAVRLFLRVPIAALADGITPAAALGIALHRLGCFLRGCCLGTLCDAAWCVRYPRRSVAFLWHAQAGLVAGTDTASAPVHPLPLYFAAVAVGIAALARWRLPRRRHPGEVACLALLAFAASTVGLETLRADPAGRIAAGTWPPLQLAALAATAAALLLLVATEVRAWRRRTAASITTDDRR